MKDLLGDKYNLLKQFSLTPISVIHILLCTPLGARLSHKILAKIKQDGEGRGKERGERREKSEGSLEEKGGML